MSATKLQVAEEEMAEAVRCAGEVDAGVGAAATDEVRWVTEQLERFARRYAVLAEAGVFSRVADWAKERGLDVTDPDVDAYMKIISAAGAGLCARGASGEVVGAVVAALVVAAEAAQADSVAEGAEAGR